MFPTVWAARAFAITATLQDRGLVSGREWAIQLGASLAADAGSDGADPEAYWRAWLAALETVLAEKNLAESAALTTLQQAWREAAARTPHGQPVELARGDQA